MTRSRKSQDIYALLRGRIEAGEFSIGGAFPTEERLCIEDGVTRYALRKALDRLESDGLIRRRRGAGTHVVSRTPTSVFRHATGSRTELLNYVEGTHVRWSPVEQVRTSGALARLLGCDEMREWQKLPGVRHDHDNSPLAIVEVYGDPARARLPDRPQLEGGPVYEWLERAFGVRPTTLSQDIRAKPLSAQEATLLMEPEGASVLQMIRRYFDEADTLYQISVTTHRSRDFVYNLRIKLMD